MTNQIRYYIKLVLVLVVVVFFLLLTSIINFFIRNKKLSLILRLKITSFLSWLILMVLNVRLRTDKSNFNPARNENYLIIANHLSYLDTFIIASKINSVFVASIDGHQQKFPVGLITKNSGGIFIERKNKKKVVRDLQKISDMLKTGFNVVLFPEGTTSDGTTVLPFKTPFFYSVTNKDAKILPVCINYRKINNSNITKKNKHLVFFYEKISFIQHFMRVLKLKKINVDIKFGEIISADNYFSRKDIANYVYEKIFSVYEPKL